MMQYIEEHQEIPKGEAAGTPVEEPRKRRRVRNLVAERRQKPKERTQGYGESRRKLAAACRKVSRSAKVAWRKRNIIRKIQTQGNCRWRKELSASRNMKRRVAVARHKGNFVSKQSTRGNVEQETQKGRAEKKCLKYPECKTGIKDPRTRRHLCLQMERTTEEFNRKVLGLEFLKRANGTFVG
jgi:hypothetical protein